MNAVSHLSQMWVLVGEADVLAAQGYSLTQDGLDAGLYVRNTLAIHRLPAVAIRAPYRLSMKCQPEQFRLTVKTCRETFHRRLLATLAHLDASGESPLPKPATPQSVLDYAERVLRYGEMILRRLERDEAAVVDACRQEMSLDRLRSVVGQLARQLSERLSADSVFYDAVAQSVRIPTEAELAFRHLRRSDDLWLVPVTWS